MSQYKTMSKDLHIEVFGAFILLSSPSLYVCHYCAVRVKAEYIVTKFYDFVDKCVPSERNVTGLPNYQPIQHEVAA